MISHCSRKALHLDLEQQVFRLTEAVECDVFPRDESKRCGQFFRGCNEDSSRPSLFELVIDGRVISQQIARERGIYR